MDRLFSSAPTASSIDDHSEQNIWNPQLELLFSNHVNGIVDSYLVDLDLAKIALSCHFALDSMIHRAPLLLVFAVVVSSLSYLSFVPFTIAPNHMLAVWFRALMRYPNSRLPCIGILIGLYDTNLTGKVTIANAYDFAATCAPPS